MIGEKGENIDEKQFKYRDKMRVTWHIMSLQSEKVVGTCPQCHPPNCAHAHDYDY